MKRQVLVVGLGRFGASVATTLFNQGHEVMAIDHHEQRVQDVMSQVTYAVQADATNEAALRELGAANFDLAVVATGIDIQSSLLSTVLLQRMGLQEVVARAQNEIHGLTLEKIGAHRIIYPEKEAGERLAHNISFPDVVDYMELGPGYGLSKFTVPPSAIGKTLEEADLGAGSSSGLTVLVILRGNDVTLTPDRFERIQEGDILVVTGSDEQLERFEAPGSNG
ncbi:MAG: TrkA family potassium uptake protein [Chloroflexi bacterium]|nr:TrkA family potassium uptake protein [Chloroflexota bacterium]